MILDLNTILQEINSSEDLKPDILFKESDKFPISEIIVSEKPMQKCRGLDTSILYGRRVPKKYIDNSIR